MTFTSNAIEGNTLTRRETGQVINHGVTLGGKAFADHMEALDHHDALRWMHEIARGAEPITAMTVRQLHQQALKRSNHHIAGQLAVTQRYIGGSEVKSAYLAEVGRMLTYFGDALKVVDTTPHAPSMHIASWSRAPCDDGNGRTARLLMNLMLIRGGYRPVAIRLGDRNDYLNTLEIAQLTGVDVPIRPCCIVASKKRWDVKMAGPTPAELARLQSMRGQGR